MVVLSMRKRWKSLIIYNFFKRYPFMASYALERILLFSSLKLCRLPRDTRRMFPDTH